MEGPNLEGGIAWFSFCPFVWGGLVALGAQSWQFLGLDGLIQEMKLRLTVQGKHLNPWASSA